MPPVHSRDLIDAEPFRTGDHRGVDRPQRKVAVPVDEVGDTKPVNWMDGLDVERGGRQIAEKAQLGLGPMRLPNK
jgi:hypothetical protein